MLLTIIEWLRFAMKLDVFMDSGVDKFHTNHFLRGAVEACQSDAVPGLLA